MLSTGAFNALLKTLEEPPEYAVFFLIVERMSALLSTIVSRCAVHHVHPLEEEDCAQVLRERGVDPQQAPLLARAAQGSVGRALQIASDEAYMNDVRAVNAALDGVRAASDIPAAALSLCDEKRDAERTLELVEGWARAALKGGRLGWRPPAGRRGGRAHEIGKQRFPPARDGTDALRGGGEFEGIIEENWQMGKERAPEKRAR